MRKIVLALVVLLLTVPAMAGVEVVKCAQVSEDSYEVAVTYDVNDGNEIRAFGIEISVDNGASISSIDVNDADYYIFPGSIDINEAGDVNDWGSAIAAQTSNSFILEMGSLYAAEDPCHTTAPPASGQLCSFMVSGDCNVAIANDAARGGVVLADTTKSFEGDLIGCQVTLSDCYTGPDYTEWVNVGKPDSWCYPSQCYGDADGLAESVGRGSAQVYDNDVAILVVGYGDTAYSGDPAIDPWIAADFDHAAESVGRASARVYDNDVAILVNYYGESSVPSDCLD
jgi:hypothetical protein